MVLTQRKKTKQNPAFDEDGDPTSDDTGAETVVMEEVEVKKLKKSAERVCVGLF